MRIKISVPATSANLGSGFDVLGLAVNLRNDFFCEYFSPQEKPKIKLNFQFTEEVKNINQKDFNIPSGRENLIAHSYLSLFEKAELTPLSAEFQSMIRIPFSRGLGSSSTAILAGLISANEGMRHHYKRSFSIEQIFQFASYIEGHPDNLAPAIWGGLMLSLYDENEKKYIPISVPVLQKLGVIALIPHQPVSTQEARQILPTSVPLKTVAFQSSRTALLVNLMNKTKWDKQDKKNLKLAFQDKIHQEARGKLLPGIYETLLTLPEQGALGAFISGSGPSILSFWEDPLPKELGHKFDEEIGYKELKIDTEGLFFEIISPSETEI